MSTPGWRDPRLWVGIALVTGSVVAGARVFASVDDTTEVWAAAGELAPGQVLTADDLTRVPVRFADDKDAARYVSVEDRFPSDVTLARGLGEGELVPRAALGSDEASATTALPLALPPEAVPGSISAGSRVDVWIVPDEADAEASQVLEDVAVIDVPRDAGGFAASSSQQVVLAVPRTEDEVIAEVLAASRTDAVRITGGTQR